MPATLLGALRVGEGNKYHKKNQCGTGNEEVGDGVQIGNSEW